MRAAPHIPWSLRLGEHTPQRLVVLRDKPPRIAEVGQVLIFERSSLAPDTVRDLLQLSIIEWWPHPTGVLDTERLKDGAWRCVPSAHGARQRGEHHVSLTFPDD